jgi:thioesterase domain-containing protein
MIGNATLEQAQDTEPFDPIAAFLDLKFRKKGPLVKLNKSDEGVPVYFVHELMGDVSCYHRVVDGIDVPAFGIQVPQAERTSSIISTIEDLAARYVELIVQNQPEGPIRLVGWSAGATIALEVARQLTSIGRQPQILVSIDQQIDNAKGIVSPYHSFLENLYYWICNEPKWPLSKFGGRLLEKFTENFVSLIRRTPPVIPVHDPKNAIKKVRTPEETEFIRKLYDLLFAYIPPRSYPGLVLSLIGTENEQSGSLMKSWRSIAPNTQFIFVPGDHQTLVKGPGAIEVREHIGKVLAELSTTPTPGAPAEP